MTRARLDPPSESQFVPPLLRWARARGADVEPLKLAFKLPDDSETRRTAPLRLEEWGSLLERVSTQLALPALGLDAGSEVSLAAYDLAELRARASRDLADGLRQLARFSPLIHERMVLELREGDGAAVLLHRLVGHPRGVGRHASDFCLAWLLRQLRAWAGESLAPRRVSFIHARPRDLAPLHAFFRTQELEFGCAEDALEFSQELLALPLQHHDPRLAQTAEEMAQSALASAAPTFDLVAAVNAKLREELPRATPTLATIAQKLHMAPRTLQRRLEEQGVPFSELLDLTRAQRARELLRDETKSLTEIAFNLGFHDLATFSRAFKRWTGMPPGMFRRR